MAISLDSRTRETMRGRKYRPHCALSVLPTDARIPRARGALYFKPVARKQIRIVHVARISRPAVCPRVGYVRVDLYVGDPSPSLAARTFPMSTGGRGSSPSTVPKGHGLIGNYAILLLGLHVVHGINAISEERGGIRLCLFSRCKRFHGRGAETRHARNNPAIDDPRLCNMSRLIEFGKIDRIRSLDA